MDSATPISHTPKPKLRTNKNQVVVSKIYLFSPWKLGKIPILTNIVQMGWFNHQPKNHVLGRSAESQNDLLFYNVLWFEMPQEGTAGPLEDLLIWWFFDTSGIPKLRQKNLFYLGFFMIMEMMYNLLPPASLISCFIRCCDVFFISCLYGELVWDKPLPLALFFQPWISLWVRQANLRI